MENQDGKFQAGNTKKVSFSKHQSQIHLIESFNDQSQCCGVKPKTFIPWSSANSMIQGSPERQRKLTEKLESVRSLHRSRKRQICMEIENEFIEGKSNKRSRPEQESPTPKCRIKK
jgi:hypothetical protein